MAIRGLLVEYLISGALALPWLYPLLKGLGIDVTQPTVLALFVIGLYGVGMAIDFFAFWLVKPLKPRIRRLALQRLGDFIKVKGGIAGRSTVRSVQFAL